MFTSGAKLYFGLAALSIAGAVVYSWGSHGGLLGPVTFGLYGGVGERTGYIVLLAVGGVSLFVGSAALAFRDADAEAVAQVLQAEQAPEANPPQHASYWPAIGAAAAGTVAVGAVANTQIFLLGCIVGFVALLEWMVAAWSDRATGDPEVNRRLRNRIMHPLEFPVFGAIGVVVAVLCVSRVLLALSKNGAAIAAIAVAVLILGTAIVLSVAPNAGRAVFTTVLVVAAIGVLTGGIIAAAEGERTFHPEGQQETKYQPPDRNQPIDAPLQRGGATTTTQPGG